MIYNGMVDLLTESIDFIMFMQSERTCKTSTVQNFSPSSEVH